LRDLRSKGAVLLLRLLRVVVTTSKLSIIVLLTARELRELGVNALVWHVCIRVRFVYHDSRSCIVVNDRVPRMALTRSADLLQL